MKSHPFAILAAVLCAVAFAAVAKPAPVAAPSSSADGARRTPRTLWAQAPIRGKALRFSPDPFCRFRDTASAFADDPLNYGGLRSAPAARLRPAGYAVASSGRHFTRGLL